MSTFLKNLPVKVLGGIPSVLDPLPPSVTHCMNTYGTSVLIHTGKGGGTVGEPVRSLEGC